MWSWIWEWFIDPALRSPLTARFHTVFSLHLLHHELLLPKLSSKSYPIVFATESNLASLLDALRPSPASLPPPLPFLSRPPPTTHHPPPSAMATSSHSKGFTFGVEIEIYLKPKVETVSSLLKERKWTTGDELTPDERRDNRAAILATIAAILIEAGLDAVTTVKNAKDEYADWLVKFDASLPHAGGYCEYHHTHIVTTHNS